MEVISTEHMPYTIRRRDPAYYDKIKEQRLEKHFDSIQTDSEICETIEITQSLESSVKESLASKQAEQDEWVNLSEYWEQVADIKDWDNAKSRLDKSKPCKMSVVKRKRDALKHFKQRAVKKAESLGVEYEMRYVKSVNRWGMECHLNRKDLFVRRKHVRLFFSDRQGKTIIVRIKNRQQEVIKTFGVDNHIQNKLATHGIQYQTFIARLHSGWSVESASTTPPKNRNTKRFLKMYPYRAHEIRKPKQRKTKCK